MPQDTTMAIIKDLNELHRCWGVRAKHLELINSPFDSSPITRITLEVLYDMAASVRAIIHKYDDV